MSNALGRRVPTDWKHVEKYPFSAVAPATVVSVNRILALPKWHWSHDQGHEGACEGFGNSMMMSILNKNRYDPWWLWDNAKIIDEWPDTNPGDANGTSGRAACEVLRAKGHVLWNQTTDAVYGNPSIHDNRPADPAQGINTYRWAQTVDEMRTAIAANNPVAIGVNWYTNFDGPKLVGTDYWIGKGSLGSIRGGHCICIYGASDRRQAFRLKNSWGKNYPLVWLPYDTMTRLISESGEVALITDK